MSDAEQKPKRLLSLRGYAKHRGVNLFTIQKAIETGRITPVVEGGKQRIDPEVSDRQFEANTDPAKQNRAKEQSFEADEVLDERSKRKFRVARTDKEYYQSKLKRIELRKLEGKLVDAKEVEALLQEAAQSIRDAILSIPDRLATQLAGTSDPHKVHVLLTEELTHALERLVNAGQRKENL